MKLLTFLYTLCLSFLLTNCLSSQRYRIYQTNSETTTDDIDIEIEPTNIVEENKLEQQQDELAFYGKKSTFHQYILGFFSVFAPKVIQYKDGISSIYRQITKGENCDEEDLKRLFKQGSTDYTKHIQNYQSFQSQNKGKEVTPSQIIQHCLEHKINLEKEKEELEGKKNDDKSKYKKELESKQKITKKYLKKKKKLTEKLKHYYESIEKILKKKIEKTEKDITNKSNNSDEEEKIEGIEKNIAIDKKSLIEIKKEIQKNELEISKLNMQYETLSSEERIKEIKIELDNNCADFAMDPNKGFEYSTFKKILHLKDFVLHLIGCGSQSEALKTVASGIFNLIRTGIDNNSNVIDNIVKNNIASLIKDGVFRIGRGVFYLYKLLKAVKQKKKNCRKGNIKLCSFDKGVVLGTGIRALVAIAMNVK